MEPAYQLYGLRPSFYTRKVAAMLAAMRLPHEDLLKTAEIAPEVEAAVGGYRKFPVLRTPEDDWVTDSTDIGLYLGRQHPDAAILPADPAMRAAALILDDWADEWLLRPTLHWRVTDAENRRWVARHAVAGMNGDDDPGEDPGEAHDHPGVGYASQFFAGAGAVNRVGEDYAQEVLGILHGAADALAAHFETRPFLLGTRVSLPDFAMFGFLEAGLLWEPAARAYVEPRWPALAAFAERVRLAVAGDGDFDNADSAPETLRAFFAGMDDFAAFLGANAAAVAAGEKEARWSSDGEPRVMRARGFTEKCRKATGAVIADLGAENRAALAALAGTPLIDAYTR
ncbi:hypothetical protein B5C34_02085 [Pacificimonas flava]|uniref:GST N-terminal domain-containing protein n=2 Tax=Pacificimonas TaxID=1960290 RepID=A0A219B1X7_9SPHN|nr:MULTISPECIES: glutathione S-transferase family protein [Pacificimonas]MBZ6377992.1 glutathione S-transferase family protein [Pacificimonas aurantium]OWV32362.1 hypothetical protein B5C34_02085 [Pacificimonas flava]